MATTSRRKKVQPVDERKEFLDSSHLLRVETLQRDVINARLAMAVEEQALKNMALELKILENDIEKKKILVSSKAQKYEIEKQKLENLKRDLFKEYGFKENENLAYNAEDGKIIRNAQ